MLVAISAMHNRHALSRAWVDHTQSLGFDGVVVSVTHDDQPNISYCWAMHYRVLETANSPLALKFNAALHEAMKMGAERVMILPADDFASPAWVKTAREHEGDYLYPHTCAIFDSETQAAYKIRKLGLNEGAQVGTLRFGAGRVISRKVIEKLNGQLWPEHLTKGLDTASHNAIIRAGFKPKVVDTGSIPITDVKTYEINPITGQKQSANLWPWGAWQGSGDPISCDEALHMVSNSVKSQLLGIVAH